MIEAIAWMVAGALVGYSLLVIVSIWAVKRIGNHYSPLDD